MYKRRDLGVPDKVIDIALMVIDEGTKFDQALNAKSIVIGGTDSFDVRNVSPPLDPGMDASLR